MRVLHTLRSGKGKVWNNFKKLNLKSFELGKFCFIKTKFKPNLS